MKMLMNKVTSLALTTLLLAPLAALYAADAPKPSSAVMQQLLAASVARAAAEGRADVHLPAGIVLLEHGLVFEGLRNLVIDGTGTTLVCRDWKDVALHFKECAGITLRGVTIDYDPLPFTQGTVIGRAEDGVWIELKLHEGYRDYDEGFREGTVAGFAHVFEPQEHRWKTNAPDLFPKRITVSGPRRLRLEPHPNPLAKNVQVGDRVVFDYRGRAGIRFLKCENVRVKGVTILAAPGVALMCRYMKGENRFSYDIRPGPPPSGASQPRLISSCADGFNYAQARQGPVVENCHFSFMGDDSVNLHGPTFMVAEQITDREIIVGWQWNQEYLPWLIQPGDIVRRLKHGNFSIGGEAALESFAHETKPDARWTESVRQHWPKLPEMRGFFRLKLRASLPCEPGEAIEFPGLNAPNFRIVGCEFRDHRARGLRIAASHGLIEDNVFERIKWNGLSVGPEFGYWCEAGWVSDLIIRKNRFREVNLASDREAHASAAISIMARTDSPSPWPPDGRGNARILIEENVFDHCGGEPVKVDYAREVTIK